MTAHALVVEDDPDLQNLLRSVMTNAGFEVAVSSTRAEALAAVQDREPELITLDLNLPDGDGLTLCRELRQVTDAYVIILTARSESNVVLLGLESGADDYLRKPFSTLELNARVNALLRRPRVLETAGRSSTGGVLAHGDLVMDTDRRTIEVGGSELGLTKLEYDLLAALAARPEQLVSREELMIELWGASWRDRHLVDVHVANLRRKMRPAGSRVQILTVRGLGYRLHEPAS
ncbi:response regulator transcription factor [Nocardioides marmorisolisilvae]|uniref:DNA-binding response regulator n=1 Tax=Nocardioides marmorisolisilvae TaxID=1542737 RepID=A0A3N0DS91_9ACTN|nr:response regulator transcription factor [Nocardioides marmorisolisilvae]RNL78497.1 DNA-binding response regulator [Nocardioides marmorisolisilvae]